MKSLSSPLPFSLSTWVSLRHGLPRISLHPKRFANAKGQEIRHDVFGMVRIFQRILFGKVESGVRRVACDKWSRDRFGWLHSGWFGDWVMHLTCKHH